MHKHKKTNQTKSNLFGKTRKLKFTHRLYIASKNEKIASKNENKL